MSEREGGKVDTVVVDKTGSLTKGKPHLTTVVALPGQRESELLHLVASLERGSEHPLAAAIVAGAHAKELALAPVAEFRLLTGSVTANALRLRTLSL